jgi:hypothetical protein
MQSARLVALRRFTVAIDGQPALATKVSGGHVKARVATVFDSAGGPPHLNIASVGYADLRVEVGLSMGNPILNWVNTAIANDTLRKTGTVIQVDDQGKARSYLDFREAVITEFVVPSSDASKRVEGTFGLTAAIRESVVRPGDGADLSATVNAPQKKFLTANFRVRIGSLPTARVITIGALPFRRTTGGLQPPELVITFPVADFGSWAQWADDFIVRGNNGQDKELQGSIEWLDASLRNVVAKLTLGHIGIFELAHDDPEVQPDAPARAKASMYFETGRLTLT